MNLAIVSTTIFFALLLLACRGTTQTEELVGEQLRLTGQWTEDRFKATRVRLWETKEDPQRGRVASQIVSNFRHPAARSARMQPGEVQ